MLRRSIKGVPKWARRQDNLIMLHVELRTKSTIRFSTLKASRSRENVQWDMYMLIRDDGERRLRTEIHLRKIRCQLYVREGTQAESKQGISLLEHVPVWDILTPKNPELLSRNPSASLSILIS
ncbi:uncharacterized protein MYCFIDRAFT_175672 [Pseudocercospora fijiensis CIRAD86]|uniref:Uncharacterized protein n=1 Tax=Pseudocercospora fijiensis (strain CIRAD86) TaxID=383855 RepID=M2ZSY3_PSEFD|nr:uncharacterized protein MYCFIDRAFT_175672 [Pseudocercospora fijiensis CIRAD86]EME82124.1 hypothetical protein MYCFIDRAFT_175672 [Pseudocercospora fijiensis CIRAD86]